MLVALWGTGTHWWTADTILLKVYHVYSPHNPAPWSQALSQAYLQHYLWTLALLAHHNRCNMSEVLTSIRTHLTPSPDDKTAHSHSIMANLQHAQNELWQAKQDAEELCKKHLEALLNEAHTCSKWKNPKLSCILSVLNKLLLLHCLLSAHKTKIPR